MSGDHNDYRMKVEVVKDNWKYDPITGEPLINGYPLHSGLPKKVWGNWMSDEFDRRDSLQKLTDWEEKYRPEELEVVKSFDEREWVGFTKDEIDNMDLPDWSTREELVWIIEAKLKEKNA